MPAVATDWFLGYVTIPAQSFLVNASAASVAAGTYCLRHSTGAVSLVDAFDAAIVAAVGGTASCSLSVGGLVFAGYSGNRSVTWGSATILRDLLGFTQGDLASSDFHIADDYSPLFWSPGYPGTPATIRGRDGYLVPHQVLSKSDDGSRVDTYHFSEETHQELGWSHIMPERLMVEDSGDGGGTFYEFHRQVGMIGSEFLWYPDIEEDVEETEPVTFTTPRGPYVLRAEARSGDWYRRNVPTDELSSPLALPMQLVSEP
jgi:hypothetical protein